MTPLTNRQATVLAAIHVFQRTKGYPPNVREIGEMVGCAHPNGTLGHLRALRRKGRIDWEPNMARTIRIRGKV